LKARKNCANKLAHVLRIKRKKERTGNGRTDGGQTAGTGRKDLRWGPQKKKKGIDYKIENWGLGHLLA